MDTKVASINARLSFLIYVACRELVVRLVDLGLKETRYFEYSMLFAITYIFLLRLPSEAVPITAGTGQNALRVESNEITLSLARRKNKPQGSLLKRGCWCSSCEAICPLHVIGQMVKDCPSGDRWEQV